MIQNGTKLLAARTGTFFPLSACGGEYTVKVILQPQDVDSWVNLLLKPPNCEEWW